MGLVLSLILVSQLELVLQLISLKSFTSEGFDVLLLDSDVELLLHSDQGWQYQSPDYQRKLLNKGIKHIRQ